MEKIQMFKRMKPESACWCGSGKEYKNCHMEFDKRVNRARKIQRFLSQPFFVAEQFSGIPGKYVKLEDTIRGFKEIIEGKHDDLPEQAFYMVGTIEEAIEKAKTLQ